MSAPTEEGGGAAGPAEIADWLGGDGDGLDALPPRTMQALLRRRAEWMAVCRANEAYQELAGEARRTIADLRARVDVDALTGILNRRGIEALRDREVDRARQTGTPVAVLVADLDGLKRVNDLHGHPAGDAMLRAAAGAIRRALRPGDEVGRIGGDEFLCVVPGAAVEQAQLIAARIADATDTLPVDGASGMPLILSVGWASTSEGLMAAGDLMHVADTRLYALRNVRRGQNGPEAARGTDIASARIRVAIRAVGRSAELIRLARGVQLTASDLIAARAGSRRQPAEADPPVGVPSHPGDGEQRAADDRRRGA